MGNPKMWGLTELVKQSAPRSPTVREKTEQGFEKQGPGRLSQRSD